MIKGNWTKPRSKVKMVSALYDYEELYLMVCRLIVPCANVPAAFEIQNLRREAQAFKSVRALLRSGSQDDGNTSAARRVFDKACSWLLIIMLSQVN